MEHNTTILIQRIRENIDSRNQVIRELYNDEKISNSIYSFVLKNGGTTDDAHDLLTHAIISFVHQCYSPVFEIKHQLNTYLYSIARYKWINDRNAASKMRTVDIENREEDFTPSIEESIIGDERRDALKKALTHLDEKCKEVMTLWASQLKMREIAIRMSYASEQVARKKKHQCLNKLKELFKDI